MEQMNVAVMSTREELEASARAWDELARRNSRDGFFRTFSWYRAWLDHIRPDAEPFVVTARDSSGTIVGLAPLCRLDYRDLGFRLRALAWAGREVVSGDFLDILASPANREEIVAAVLGFLWEVRSQWSMLVIGELLDGSDSYRALERMSEQHGLPVRRQEERICPYITLPASFEDYLNGLGRSTRYHIRRRMRECEKSGATIDTYTQGPDVAARLESLVRLHLARWANANLPGTLSRPGFTAFLRQVLTTPPEGASFRLYELTSERKPVASLLMFYYGDSALYYQAGWDPHSSLAPFSPGVVLMAHSIRDAIENGLRHYDFLRGDEAYKSRWTKTYRKTITVLLARSWMSKRFLDVTQLKDAVKGHLPGRRAELTEPGETAAPQ